jgi:hypothetical protein
MGNNDVPGRKGSTSRRAFLSATAVTAVAAPLITGTSVAGASPVRISGPATDKGLRDLLSRVDPARIQATIAKLVSFGTRHTASSQTDPVRGIGAATNWVFGQMQAIAATSSGRMTVQQQTFTQSPTATLPLHPGVRHRGRRGGGAVRLGVHGRADEGGRQ